MNITIVGEGVGGVGTMVVPYEVLSGEVYRLIENQPQRVYFGIYEEAGKVGDEVKVVTCPDITSEGVVIEGDIKFAIRDERFTSKVIVSRVYSDPNWGDILNCCDELLRGLGEVSYGVLVDVMRTGEEGMYEFIFA